MQYPNIEKAFKAIDLDNCGSGNKDIPYRWSDPNFLELVDKKLGLLEPEEFEQYISGDSSKQAFISTKYSMQFVTLFLIEYFDHWYHLDLDQADSEVHQAIDRSYKNIPF